MMSQLWWRLAERSKKAIVAAQEEAAYAGEAYVTPEHLLLGLLRDSETLATKILKRLDVDPAKVRREVERQIGNRGYGRLNNNAFTLEPRLKTALDLADEEAQSLGTKRIGTEHLLLGILREDAGIAFTALRECGAEVDTVRSEAQVFYHEQRREGQGP